MNIHFDPIEEANKVRRIVEDGDKRKYYRVARPGRWYGGIATADCIGCNLKCVFCWSNIPRDDPASIGEYYGPEYIADRLIKCAEVNDYKYVRLSGNEPTLAREHLVKVLSIIDRSKYRFILETNGSLLDREFIMELAQFNHLHIRVSLKGTTDEEFTLLTGATPQTFMKIVDNVKHLVENKLPFNVAVMLSFSPDKNIAQLKTLLRKISSKICDEFEEEYIILYPHVVRRLKNARLVPYIAYTSDGIPKRLI